MERARHRGVVLTVQRLLWDAPWWVWALAYAGLFALPWTVFVLVGDAPVPLAVAVVGVQATIGATVAHRRQREARWATATVPAGRLDEVLAAAHRGPVPDDEEVRAPARRLVTHRLGLLKEWHVYSVVMIGLVLLGLLGLALARRQIWTALLAAALAVSSYRDLVLRPRRLRERLRLLRSPAWD